jgi:WD40 repeat protein
MSAWRSLLSTFLTATVVSSTIHAQSPKLDRYGDPLPAGAIARLGTIRWRTASPILLAVYLDEKSILSVTRDLMAQVWDVPTGKELRHFNMAVDDVGVAPFGRALRLPDSRRVVVSGNRRRIACNGGRGAIRVVDIPSGKELPFIKTDQSYGAAFALSHDGETLAAMTSDGRLELFNKLGAPVFVQRKVTNFPARTDIGSLHFSQPGKPLELIGVTSSDSKPPQAVRWNLGADPIVFQADTLPDEFADSMGSGVVVSPDHKFAAVCPITNMSATVAALDSGKRSGDLNRGMSPGSPFGFSPDSAKLLIVDAGWGAITTWDLASNAQVSRVNLSESIQPTRFSAYDQVPSLELSPDAKTLLVPQNFAICLIDLATGKTRNGLGAHSEEIVSIALSADGKSIYTKGMFAHMRWNAATSEPEPLPAVFRQIGHQHVSPDGRLFVVGGVLQRFRVVDIATGNRKCTLDAGSRTLTQEVLISPDSRVAAVTSGEDPTVLFCDTETGKKINELRPQESDSAAGQLISPKLSMQIDLLSRRCCFSPDCRLFLLGNDSAVTIWDWRSGNRRGKIGFAEGESLAAVTISPDECWAITETGAGELSVWETATGERVSRLGRSANPNRFDQLAAAFDPDGLDLKPLVFSGDGRLVASTRRDGTIVIWEFWSLRELGTLSGHAGRPTAITFSPNSQLLLSGSADTTALIWDVVPYQAKAAIRKVKLNEARIKQISESLLDPKANALDAILALSQDPNAAVPFLRERLHQARIPDKERVARWIADLNDSNYITREKATNALAQAGEAIVPALREALQKTESAEVRSRAQKLISLLDNPQLQGERLRACRAIEALELIGSNEARDILRSLAAGADVMVPTRQAAAALARLNKSPK